MMYLEREREREEKLNIMHQQFVYILQVIVFKINYVKVAQTHGNKTMAIGLATKCQKIMNYLNQQVWKVNDTEEC